MSTIVSFKTVGTAGVPVTVECQITPGIGIHLVGLADVAVKESLLRTVTALQSLGYHIPGKKVVINLAPSDLNKDGGTYDLPVALAILAASGQEKLPDLDKYVIAGELGLDGSLRDIPGWMQCAELATKMNKCAILPTESAGLAANALQGDGIQYGADDLKQVIDILNGGAPDQDALDECSEVFEDNIEDLIPVWDNIKGHEGAKRALEIAAAGGHPVLLVGPPDNGSARLAAALNDILPPLEGEEALEVQRIYSAADRRIIPGLRPFRAPHYASSMATLLGGGYGENIRPGEVSLAHNGVLFFDECAEAPKALMDGLRGPLEDGKVTISRLKNKVDFPTKFFPVFAANPCPCGYYGEGDRCTCTPAQRAAYLGRLSGPVYDRLTMQVWCHPAAENTAKGEPACDVAERVAKARVRQMDRQGKLNDELDSRELDNVTCIGGNAREVKDLIETLMVRMQLSARSYSRMLKIARTIADLDGRDQLTTSDVAEAASYRFLDRQNDTNP